MEPLKVFRFSDLRRSASGLMREAEAGRLALITKHGRPVILAVPFDERLQQHGLRRRMVLHLFEQGQVSLAQGARLAAISLEEFISLWVRVPLTLFDTPRTRSMRS